MSIFLSLEGIVLSKKSSREKLITEEEVDAARGVIVLKAAIDYTRSWKEPLDFLGLNGKTVTLELYLSSVHPTIPNAF